MRYMLSAGLILFVVIGCADSEPTPQRTTQPRDVAPSPRVAEPPRQQRQQEPDVQIPDDVHYTIIDEETVPRIKRSLDVRLNKRVSEDVLKLIASELRRKDDRRYDRTFITYYLEDMKVGEGAWATSHFTPNLQVRILGMTEQQYQAMQQASPDEVEGEILGQWLDESPIVGGRITIMEVNGKWYLKREFQDGSSGKREIIERDSRDGRRFDLKEQSSAGDHWIIATNGNLLIRDNEGTIAIAKPIN